MRLVVFTALAASTLTISAETVGDTRMVVSTQCSAGTCTRITIHLVFVLVDGLGTWTISHVDTTSFVDPRYTRQN